MRPLLAVFSLAVALLGSPSPAEAQWTRVTQLPAAEVYSLWANRDTIVAGVDTCVFVSTDAGAHWRAAARVLPGRPLVTAVRVRNGQLFAGTSHQGVFVSGDLGFTWNAFNQGLVGGLFDTQLNISDFATRGDSLYASTFGAGVYVRPLVAGGTWAHFGEAFEPNQASNVNALALGGTRLIASAGGNGTVFRRDPADAEWTESLLKNIAISPGNQAQSVIWNGFGWLVGAPQGVFRSTAGQEPWTLFNPGLGGIHWTAFAARERKVFAAFDITDNVVVALSEDDGASWVLVDQFPFSFVFRLAVSGEALYAARVDGLFLHTENTAAVEDVARGGLRFAVVGRQPVGDQVRFRIEMPEAGEVAIDVFDLGGRRAMDSTHSFQLRGAHELSWDARALAPGVYLARLAVGRSQRTLRLVHVR